jgi:bifunctional UDP-N-acetylglucosamine pyrophosphorylase/glucosamine-1-phosphate N-acetyltransferase
MLNGVTIVDPLSTRIEIDVKIGADTVIWPFSVLRGVTDIGDGCEIGPGARIDDARIGEHCRVRDSWVVASEIGCDTTVGPFANIRPNSTVGNRVKIGDFVELKATTLADEVSAGHFTYLGDAEVGEDTNIGAGTITCNYDGFRKHKTIIGKNAFIGSNTTLVAPVTIGDGAFVAAGSAINAEVPADALAIGRSRQTVKPDWATQWRKRNSVKANADG